MFFLFRNSRIISLFISHLRCLILRLFGAKISSNVFIDMGFQGFCLSNIFIGEYTSLGHDNHIWAFNPVYIGRRVQSAKDLLIISGTHSTNSFSPISGSCAHVTIEDGCWIGARVTIIAGVTIGRGSIIGAGSVVVKSVPPFSIAVGNPCRVIKKRVASPLIVSPFGEYQLSDIS